MVLVSTYLYYICDSLIKQEGLAAAGLRATGGRSTLVMATQKLYCYIVRYIVK